VGCCEGGKGGSEHELSRSLTRQDSKVGDELEDDGVPDDFQVESGFGGMVAIFGLVERRGS